MTTSTTTTRGGSLPPAGFLLLAAITLFWGANWPALKIALDEVPVWTFRSICLLAGGGGLLLIAAASGHRLRVPRGERLPVLLCTLFNVVGWHLCSAYGVSLMPAGRASIIAFTMPVWATLLGALLLSERVTPSKLIGLALGLAGLAALIGPDLAAVGTAPLGAVAMLGAALSWAAGTVLLKRFTWTIPTTVLAGWQLLAGAAPIVAGAVILDEPMAVSSISTAGLLATAYVIALPMLFCQWAYMKTVRLFPAALAAIGTLAIPALGVFLSALVLGEPAGARELLSLALVCAAIGVVLVLPALRARRA